MGAKIDKKKLAFYFSLIFFSVAYGILASNKQLFPVPQINSAKYTVIAMYNKLPKDNSQYHFTKTKLKEKIQRLDADKIQPGLTKMVYMDANDKLGTTVINSKGELVHSWNIDWFDMWPDATHLPASKIPKSRPGTHIHGAHIFENGDLVFNFSDLGMVRIDACSNVIWRLPLETHHSIFIDDDGNIWAPGMFIREEKKGECCKFPLYAKGGSEPVILKISPQGKVLLEKPIFELLSENGLDGLLYLTTRNNLAPFVSGDILHLNDIEIFSGSMQPGVFSKGDVMISLRNANTVIVFDQETWKTKFISSQIMIRQHDPDFYDGDTISIFDNNNRFGFNSADTWFSRIIKQSAIDHSYESVFQGTKELSFFTITKGKHQWLDNGNLLVTDSNPGRVLEVTPDGSLAWEYVNIIESGVTGSVIEAERLPLSYNKAFFAEKSLGCH